MYREESINGRGTKKMGQTAFLPCFHLREAEKKEKDENEKISDSLRISPFFREFHCKKERHRKRKIFMYQ